MADNKSIKIGRLITDKNNTRQMVLYYYVNDGQITPDQIDLRKKVVLKRLQFKRTSAAFIRILMPIYHNMENTQIILDEFLRTTLPAVIEYTDTKYASREVVLE